jgi:hypothetical protein
MRCPKCGDYVFEGEDRCVNCGSSVPSQKDSAWWGGKDFQGPDKAPDHDRNGQEEHHDGEVERSGVSPPELHSCPYCQTLSLFWNKHTVMYECLNPDCGRRIAAAEYESRKEETIAPQQWDEREKVQSPPRGEGDDKHGDIPHEVHHCVIHNCHYETECELCRKEKQDKVPRKEQSSDRLETCPVCGQGMLRWNPAISKYECLYWKCRRIIAKEYLESAQRPKEKRRFRLPRFGRLSRISIGLLILVVFAFALFYGLTHVGKSGPLSVLVTSPAPTSGPVITPRPIVVVTPIPIITVRPIPTLIPIITVRPIPTLIPLVPLATPTPTLNPALVLFKDDFSNEYSGWSTYSEGEGSAFYSNGWLHVKDYPFSQHSENSYANRYFTNFVLEVETKLVDGSDNNWHFIACRNDGVNNYYNFAISADGYYLISKWVNGVQTALVGPTSSVYINKGKGVVNLVRVECVGSNLSLSVNGHLLAKVTDYTLTGGDIALGADASGSEFTEVAFDNIVVSAP